MSSNRVGGALRRAAVAVLCALSLSSQAFAHEQDQRQIQQGQRRVPKVQIAILLDNSGSMQGLINQARTEIWKVVNEFATAQQFGVRPRLELALYEYGDGVRLLQGFTSELDRVSEKLFAMQIRGGDEYCGQVIASATSELEWSGNQDDLKLIYIAGNEPFTQGPTDYRAAIAAARSKGIVVNPILCGGEDPTWRSGAMVAGADLLKIDHNAVVAYVAAPQDAEITRLGQQLNNTYLGYGSQGAASQARQKKADQAAESAAPAAAVTRSLAKSAVQYDNAGWDLVDGVKGGLKVESLEGDALPSEMRGMNADQRREFVAAKAKERADIQKRIQQLSTERQAYLNEQAKAQPASPATLDAALVGSARKAAKEKAFSF